jgi:hypothetical protein
MSDELGPNHLRGGASDFVTSTKPTVPTRASRLRTPGKPGSIARKPHTRNTRADPPIRHPNGKLQWLHGSSSWPSPEPSIGLMVLANQEHPADFEPQRNVLRRKDNRKPSTLDTRRGVFLSARHSGIVGTGKPIPTLSACLVDIHPCGFTNRPLRREFVRFPHNDPWRTSLMVHRLDGFSKPKPPHRLHIRKGHHPAAGCSCHSRKRSRTLTARKGRDVNEPHPPPT